MKFIDRYCCVFAAIVCLFLTNGRGYSDVLALEEDYSLLTKGSEEDRGALKKLNELLEKAYKDRDVVKGWLNEYAKQEQKTYARVVNLFSKFEKSEQKRLAQDLKKGELSETFKDRLDAKNLQISFQRLEAERGYIEKIRTLYERLESKILEAESTRDQLGRRMVAGVQADSLREKEEAIDELSRFLDEAQKKLDVWKENDRKQKESLVDSILKDSKTRPKDKRSGVAKSSTDDVASYDKTEENKADLLEQEGVDQEPTKEPEADLVEVGEDALADPEADLVKTDEESPTEQEVDEGDLLEQEIQQEEVDENEKSSSPEERQEEPIKEESNWTGVVQTAGANESAVSSKSKNYVRGVDLELASKPVILQTEERDGDAQTNEEFGRRQSLSVQNVEFAFRFCPNSAQGEDEGFWIQETETTQEQWFAAGVGTTRQCSFKGAKLPVENVDWNACAMFVDRLNKLNVAPKGWRFAIPTITQWERARELGQSAVDLASLAEYAWFGENSDKKTHEVGAKKSDALGLYDMTGNVWEWTCGVDQTGRARIVCGASWNNLPQNGALTERFACSPSACGNNLGLRLVLVRQK